MRCRDPVRSPLAAQKPSCDMLVSSGTACVGREVIGLGFVVFEASAMKAYLSFVLRL